MFLEEEKLLFIWEKILHFIFIFIVLYKHLEIFQSATPSFKIKNSHLFIYKQDNIIYPFLKPNIF